MPTLTLTPEFEYETQRSWDVLTLEGPVRHRRPVHDRSRRTIVMQWSVASQKVIDTLVALWDECRGRALTFTYTPIDESEAAQWRLPDDLPFLLRNPVMRGISVPITESF